MKKICTNGFKISNADQKALDHYLIVTPKKWAHDALRGMINKALKTILKDWFEEYKETKTAIMSADIAVIIPEILKLKNFKNYNIPSQEDRKPKRKQLAINEIWDQGFEIQDHENEALIAFYKDPEQTLRDFMENKIARRKEAFVKEHSEQLIKDPKVKEIPTKDDDLIDLITLNPSYKNRKQREENN